MENERVQCAKKINFVYRQHGEMVMAKAPKSYEVLFRGYRMDIDTLPEYTGVFIAYRCIFYKKTRTVDLIEILYIGKSRNIRATVKKLHAKFLAEAKAGESVCYSYAEIKKTKLDIIENALVFAQKPRLNENNEIKTEYNFDKPAQFLIEGTCALLEHEYYTIH